MSQRAAVGAGGLAVAGLRAHARRLIATAVAIVMAVAFLAATLATMDSLQRGVQESVASGVGQRDLVVTPQGEMITPDVVRGLRQVDEVELQHAGITLAASRPGTQFSQLTTMPVGGDVSLVAGDLPSSAAADVALSTTTAAASDLDIGDDLTLTLPTADAEGDVTATVAGVIDVGDDPRLSGQDVVIAHEQTLLQWQPDLLYDEVFLDAAEGTSVAEAREAIQPLVKGMAVRGGQQEASHRVEQMTGGSDLVGAIFVGFAAVAMTTAAIVIANTFSIVLAQRVREMALLRCVGATRRQVRRSVLLEASALGAVASATGLGLGMLAAWGISAFIASQDWGLPMASGLSLTPHLLLAWAAGFLITLVAAWWPTSRATRVAPVQALSPAGPAPLRSRAGGIRLALGVIFVAAGVAGLVVAVQASSVPAGIAGGVLSFVGVLVLGVWIVPALARALGLFARPGGIPGRLAIDNAVSNPGRAAATSAALLVGVTLITMTSVGAVTAERAASDELAATYPIDVQVLSLQSTPADDVGDGFAPLPDSLVSELNQVDSVAGGVSLTGAYVRIGSDDAPQGPATALGLDPASAASVAHSPETFAPLTQGTIGAGPETRRSRGLEVGQTVRVEGPGGAQQLKVVDAAIGYDWVMHEQDLRSLAPDAGVASVLMRISDEADASEVLTEVRSRTEGFDAAVTGGAPVRESTMEVLDVMVLVTTALLAVAVVIALVGIANTLSLSVLERTREHALLRALGLSRRQLRGTLAIEGVVLAVASALLGVFLGVVYGWAGVRALLPADVSMTLSLPWQRLAVIVAVAVAAGVLASLLPARRAARIAPAEGLSAL